MIDFKEDLFEIFQENKSDYNRYEQIVEYCTRVKNVVRGNDKAEFYNILNKLELLMNNPEWQNKKAEILRIILQEKEEIFNKYEEFLS